MSKSCTNIIFLTLFALVISPAPSLYASSDPANSSNQSSAWDNMVNSLLATGLYGFDRQNIPGLTLKLQHSDNLYRGFSADKPALRGQAITFSYGGSSGLLEFSAGYILSNQTDAHEPGTIFLGLNTEPGKNFNPGRSWYLAVGLSRSYQFDEDIHFSLGNRALLMQNPFDTEEGHIFSLLFNMPISYKNYLTITPELQWSHPIPRSNLSNTGNTAGDPQEKSSQNVFYGGVSVSFSY